MVFIGKKNKIKIKNLNNSFENVMQAYPSVLKINGEHVMFYNGNDFGKYGIEVCKSDLINYYVLILKVFQYLKILLKRCKVTKYRIKDPSISKNKTNENKAFSY